MISFQPLDAFEAVSAQQFVWLDGCRVVGGVTIIVHKGGEAAEICGLHAEAKVNIVAAWRELLKMDRYRFIKKWYGFRAARNAVWVYERPDSPPPTLSVPDGN